MKFWVLQPSYEVWGLSSKPPEAIGSLGAMSPVFGDFCNFLVKIPHFEVYLSLSFYESFFLSLYANTTEYTLAINY